MNGGSVPKVNFLDMAHAPASLVNEPFAEIKLGGLCEYFTSGSHAKISKVTRW